MTNKKKSTKNRSKNTKKSGQKRSNKANNQKTSSPSNSKKKKNSKAKSKSQGRTYRGKIDITPSGVGYVATEDFPIDIKISTKNLNTALPNDEVEIILLQKNPRSTKSRQTGKVVNIIKRGQKYYTGILHIHNKSTFFISEEPKCYVDFFIPQYDASEYQKDDRMVMVFDSWHDVSKNPVGKITDKLDGKNIHDITMKEILISKGFPLTFSEETNTEVKELKEAITQQDEQERRDMRDILTFTIDPLDAKDFDDALSYQELENGDIEIGIHIADVSHYVRPGMQMDAEAYSRATSVYLPDRVLPMLPERVSNVLCSLRPHEDKRSFSVVVTIDKNDNIKGQWIGKTLIHSDHRFTYEQAQEIIEGADSEYRDVILRLDKIAKKYRQKRFSKGAINFSSVESGFIFDEELLPIGVKTKVSKDAHQLIEEYMLLANRLVAEYITGYTLKGNKKVPSIYRIHDQPNEEKLSPFAAFVEHFGYSINQDDPRSIAKSFNQMLRDSADKPEGPLLESLGIRTMSKAEYNTDNIGHYGLAFDAYTHFTSPIRRYPDILVHRTLEMLLTKTYQPIKGLQSKAIHCSEQERKATECEREANKYFQVYFMSKLIGNEYDGVISGVASFGFWVETIEQKCEGLVSIRDSFPDHNMTYVPEAYMIKSDDGLSFQMGDKVRIRVEKANLDKRQLDYSFVSMIAEEDE